MTSFIKKVLWSLIINTLFERYILEQKRKYNDSYEKYDNISEQFSKFILGTVPWDCRLYVYTHTKFKKHF